MKYNFFVFNGVQYAVDNKTGFLFEVRPTCYASVIATGSLREEATKHGFKCNMHENIDMFHCDHARKNARYNY